MYYVYNSRFQPFNLLTREELLLLKKIIRPEDKIIIGIINYSPQLIKEDSPIVRFKPEFNPLTYWERYRQISQFINDEGLGDRIAAVTPLPRPSTSMSRAEYYLPPKSERIICVPIVHDSDMEEQKIDGLREQDEAVFKIMSCEFDAHLTIITQELILSLIALGNAEWKKMVPQSVAYRLDASDIKHRLVSNGLDENKAIEYIQKAIKRCVRQEERTLLASFIDPSDPASPENAKQYEDNELTVKIDRQIEKLREYSACHPGSEAACEGFVSELNGLKEKIHTDGMSNCREKYSDIRSKIQYHCGDTYTVF